MDKKSLVKISLPGTTISSVALIIVGIILLVFPGESLDLICRIAGVIILLAGLAQFAVAMKGNASAPEIIGKGSGVLIICIGILFIISPGILVSILPLVAGIYLVLHNVMGLVNSLKLAGAKDGYWWVGILLSALGIIFGVILCFNAHSTAAFIARIIGAFMLYAGISNLWIGSRKAAAAKRRREEEAALDVEATIIDE